MKKILYVGPSWAQRSFNTPTGTELTYTNLLSELDIHALDLSMGGLSNFDNINRISHQINYDAIIWIYCEPIHKANQIMPNIDIRSLLSSSNFWEMREEINQITLSKINQLNCPVGIIGGHSDIENCNFKNITIIHPSWQKFLANCAGVQLKHGWGAEVAHRMIIQDYNGIKPSKEIVKLISETFDAWKEIELKDLFCWCHPNKNGNKLFAREIKSSVQSFINNL
jgi:hypothetical protein